MELKQQKRTFYAFMFHGILFFIGYCFVDVNTVIPMFIQSLTGKIELAGVAVTIRQFSTMLFQLVLGGYIIKVKNVPRYICTFLFISYLAPLVLCASLGLDIGGMAMAGITFAAIAIMWISDGLMVIGYYDLLGRTATADNRARILGYQQLFGGAGAIAGAYIVKRLLDAKWLEFSQKYTMIFALGTFILVLGGCCMLFVKDVPDRKVQNKYSLKEQLLQMKECIKENKSFRVLMICQVFFIMSAMVAPFVLLMCESTGRAEPEFISSLLNLQVVGTLIGGAVSAFLAPKRGNMLVCVVYCLLSALCGIFGFFTIIGIGFTVFNMAVTALTAGISYAAWAGFINAILDFSKKERSHSYLLVNSALSLPLSFATILAGQIVKYFGYVSLFLIASVLAMVSVVIAIYLYKLSSNTKR